MKRRQFIKSLGIGTATVALTPHYLLASEKLQSPKMNLEVTVDKLENDFINNDYYSNGENSLLYQALKSTKKFYSEMGKNYGLPGIDISVLNSKQLEKPETPNFKFQYTTIDKFMNKIENDPNLIENIFGKEKADEIKIFGDYALEIARQKTIQKYKNETSSAGGVCISGLREIFLFADWYKNRDFNNPKNRSGAISLMGHINNHELGHMFGLDHMEKSSENKNNIMIPEPSMETVLNPQLNKNQVSKILKYFK